MTVLMRDCTARLVPGLHEFYPDDPVAGYVTGGPTIAWTDEQFAMFSRKIRICQAPGAISMAREAREADVEPGAMLATDVPAWVQARAAYCPPGRNDAQVYCSLETVPSVLEACGGDIAFVPRWRLAWWWGGTGAPTLAQVQAELANVTGITLPADRIWACQYASNDMWDTSIVYGPEDFAR